MKRKFKSKPQNINMKPTNIYTYAENQKAKEGKNS
jgi:hypothetical protein